MDIDASQKGRWGFPVDLVYNLADPNSHPDTFNAAIGTATHEEAKWNYALYVQDTWQVTRQLHAEPGTALRRGQHDHRRQRARRRAQRALPWPTWAPRRSARSRRTSTTWRRGSASSGCPPTIASSPSAAARALLRPEPLQLQRRLRQPDAAGQSSRQFQLQQHDRQPALQRGGRTGRRRGFAAARSWPSAFRSSRTSPSLGLIPELAVALAPDFRVPYTQAGDGRLLTTASRQHLGPGRLRLFGRRRCAAAAERQSGLRQRRNG